jgi:hypothetical protein
VHHGVTVKQRHDGWTRRAVIGATMAVPLMAAAIWMRFDDRPLSTMALQTPKAVIRAGRTLGRVVAAGHSHRC